MLLRTPARAYLTVLLLLVLSACFGNAERRALRPYANATLLAGVGLGDIRLGETTLGGLTQNIGVGTVSIVFSDDTWIELSFLNREFTFEFLVTGQCQRDTGVPYERLPLRNDIKRFLRDYPSCKELPLTRLTITARAKDASGTFYQGSTEQGTKLWSSLTDVELPIDEGLVVDLMLAAEVVGWMDQLESVSFAPRLNYYLGCEAAVIITSASIDPRDSDFQANLDAAQEYEHEIVVRRLSIFQPAP